MREEIITFPGDADSAAFHVRMCGVSYCDGTYRISRPNSPIYCLEYIRKGKGYVQVNDVRFTAAAGDIYILPAGADHFYYSDDKEPWEKIWFNVCGNFAAAALEAYGLKGLYHVKQLDLQADFEAFLTHAEQLRQTSALWCFDNCAMDYLQIVQRIASAPERQEKHIPESRVQQLKQRIDSLMDFSQSYDALLQEFYYTKSHMIRAFKAEYGITPYNYLLEHKLRTAKLLLRNTALPITDISSQLGFSSCHYFSAFFSRRTGMSPRQYRGL